MTSLQIGAILAILYAFGVDPGTIANIQTILSPQAPVVQTVQVAPVLSQPTVAGNAAPDCTPSISSQVTKVDGSFEEGFDYLFSATTTVSSSCIHPSDSIVFHRPHDTFTGDYASWKRNGQLKELPDGFVFNAGFGVGSSETFKGQVSLDELGTTTAVQVVSQ